MIFPSILEGVGHNLDRHRSVNRRNRRGASKVPNNRDRYRHMLAIDFEISPLCWTVIEHLENMSRRVSLCQCEQYAPFHEVAIVCVPLVTHILVRLTIEHTDRHSTQIPRANSCGILARVQSLVNALRSTLSEFHSEQGQAHQRSVPASNFKLGAGGAHPICAYVQQRPSTSLNIFKGSGRGCPLLRASSDHCFIVGALRARRGTWPLPLDPSEAARCAST